MRPILAAVLLLMPGAAWAQSCPAPLASARKLVVVTADTLSSNKASLQRFTRNSPQAPWAAADGPTTALIGRNGVAWGYAFRRFASPGEPLKREGDNRAPLGFYRIGASFGVASSPRANYVQLRSDTVCVDDPASPAYNTITSRAQIGPTVHAETMARVPHYRHGLLVDYPTSRASRGGSCIFIHLWVLPASRGTGGCVALPAPALAGLQDFAQGGAVLAIVTRQARERFAGCLPN